DTKQTNQVRGRRGAILRDRLSKCLVMGGYVPPPAIGRGRRRVASQFVASIMTDEPSLIAEFGHAISTGSKDKRGYTLGRITDLFVAGADRFNDQQIEVFDDVLGPLIKRIESKALAELSQRLGPVNNAPIETVRQLAHDDDIGVAAPILTHS